VNFGHIPKFEILGRDNFISMVRELNFAGGLDENLYKHLQDMAHPLSGMNHETLKGKAFSILVNGMGKPVVQTPCQLLSWGSWVILKDQFCFAFFPLSKIIDLRNEVLNFAQNEGESLGAA
jgi:hypothetical protein